jgi:hypothetical protein
MVQQFGTIIETKQGIVLAKRQQQMPFFDEISLSLCSDHWLRIPHRCRKGRTGKNTSLDSSYPFGDG